MKPKRDERFAIRFSRAEKQALNKLAAERDVTASHLVRQAVKQVLANSGEGKR